MKFKCFYTNLLFFALFGAFTNGKELNNFSADVVGEVWRSNGEGKCGEDLKHLRSGWADGKFKDDWSTLTETAALGPLEDFGDVGSWQISSDRWVHKGFRCSQFTRSPQAPMDFAFAFASVGEEMVGLCIPASCEHRQSELLSLWFSIVSNRSSNPPTPMYGSPQKSHYNFLEPLTFICLIWFVLRQLFPLIGMMLERHWGKKAEESLLKRLICCFSLDRCFRRLIQAPRDPSTAISCLFGLRSIACIWVMLGHCELTMLWNLDDKRPYEEMSKHNIFFMPFVNFTLSVDVFFLLSGLLTAYHWFRGVEEREYEWRDWVRFYRHRLWRVWPTYALLVFETATIVTKFGFHPQFGMFEETTNCVNNGWRNLLFMNTWDMSAGSCMKWTWYLGADMFLFAISPIFLILLKRWRRLGLLFCGTITLIAFITRVWISQIFNLPPYRHLILQSHEPWTPDEWKNFYYLYSKPYSKLPVYILGLLTGLYLSKSNLREDWREVIWWKLGLGWLVSFCFLAWSIFGAYWAWNGHNEGFHFFHNIMLGMCGRWIWSLGLIWIIIQCQVGRAKFLNLLLSNRVFLVIANLSFTVYLLHVFALQLIWMHWPSWPIRWNGFLQFFGIFFLQLLLSFFMALGLTVAFEYPITSMESVVFATHRKKPIKVKEEESEAMIVK